MSYEHPELRHWHNDREIVCGDARVIYDTGFWHFPGGGYSSNREEAQTVAENMDRIIQSRAKPQKPLTVGVW